MKKGATAAVLPRAPIELTIDDLQIAFYVRQKPDPEHTLYLAELIEGGIELDPIVVTLDTEAKAYVVRDGRHRIEAMKLLDRKTIKAIVKPSEDLVTEIALAYKANTGGALPPTKEDTEYTVRLLLSQGVPGRDIAKLLPIPPSIAKRYIASVSMKQLRARMKQAIEAVTDGELNAPQAADKFSVDIESLRKELGGRKKKHKQAGIEYKRIVSSRYRSLSQHNAGMLKKLFNGFDDGDVTASTIEAILKVMHESNRRLNVTVKNWGERLKQATETRSKLGNAENENDDD